MVVAQMVVAQTRHLWAGCYVRRNVQTGKLLSSAEVVYILFFQVLVFCRPPSINCLAFVCIGPFFRFHVVVEDEITVIAVGGPVGRVDTQIVALGTSVGKCRKAMVRPELPQAHLRCLLGRIP